MRRRPGVTGHRVRRSTGERSSGKTGSSIEASAEGRKGIDI